MNLHALRRLSIGVAPLLLLVGGAIGPPRAEAAANINPRPGNLPNSAAGQVGQGQMVLPGWQNAWANLLGNIESGQRLYRRRAPHRGGGFAVGIGQAGCCCNGEGEWANGFDDLLRWWYRRHRGPRGFAVGMAQVGCGCGGANGGSGPVQIKGGGPIGGRVGFGNGNNGRGLAMQAARQGGFGIGQVGGCCGQRRQEMGGRQRGAAGVLGRGVGVVGRCLDDRIGARRLAWHAGRLAGTALRRGEQRRVDRRIERREDRRQGHPALALAGGRVGHGGIAIKGHAGGHVQGQLGKLGSRAGAGGIHVAAHSGHSDPHAAVGGVHLLGHQGGHQAASGIHPAGHAGGHAGGHVQGHLGHAGAHVSAVGHKR